MIPDTRPIPAKLRIFGLLPLLFFLARLWASFEERAIGNILWLCHFSNFTLALGLLTGWRFWIMLSTPWLLFGLPLWLWNISALGIGTLTTMGTHLGNWD